MGNWFVEYGHARCPSCLLKSGCNSVQCELRYLRRRDRELRRREQIDEFKLKAQSSMPLDLSLKEALIRG